MHQTANCLERRRSTLECREILLPIKDENSSGHMYLRGSRGVWVNKIAMADSPALQLPGHLLCAFQLISTQPTEIRKAEPLSVLSHGVHAGSDVLWRLSTNGLACPECNRFVGLYFQSQKGKSDPSRKQAEFLLTGKILICSSYVHSYSKHSNAAEAALPTLEPPANVVWRCRGVGKLPCGSVIAGCGERVAPLSLFAPTTIRSNAAG